ncbi:transketolase [Candidatus Woesebacteria bacterium]|nr:transketolase [Candidatus Woesebacteria bacterium]
MPQDFLSTSELEETARAVRISIISMIATAGSGHPGGALGMTDVITCLFWNVLRHTPTQPDWADRDYFFLSNGHICPLLYAVLAERGYFPKTELASLRKLGSRLQGHPHLGSLPGVENTSGPLGQGLSQAAGLAYALKLDGKSNHVYCATSDGEHQEGQTWEAYLFAAKNKLNNLTVLIDRNNIQIDGFTSEIMPLEPFRAKLESFGWQVLEIDAHNFAEISAAFSQVNSTLSDTEAQPTAIICHTIPGKGVDFMEDKFEWHGKAPTPEQAVEALKQLGVESI